MMITINNKQYESGELVAYVEQLEKENADLKCECRTCVYTDSPCVRSDYPSKDGVCSHYKNVFEENVELKQENKVLAQNLENTEILNKTYEKKNKELKTDYEVLSCSVGDFGELQDKLEEEQRKNNGLSDNLTNAKEIISEYINILKGDTKNWKKTQEKAEQFLSEVEK